jgi:hypothetical protein
MASQTVVQAVDASRKIGGRSQMNFFSLALINNRGPPFFRFFAYGACL